MSQIAIFFLIMSYFFYGPRLLCKAVADSLKELQHGLTQFTQQTDRTKTAPQTCTQVAFLEDQAQFTHDQLKMIPNYSPLASNNEERFLLTCFTSTDEIPIGLVSFWRGDNTRIWINELGIRKDFQNKGYGKMLMNHTLDLLKQRKEPIVFLNPTPESVGFYKNLGFVETGYKTSIWMKKLS